MTDVILDQTQTSGTWRVPQAFAAAARLRIYGDVAVDLPLPPSPAMPRFVQTYRLLSDPFDLISEMRSVHGDAFLLEPHGMGRTLFVSSAEMMRHVYRMPETMVIAGWPRRRQAGSVLGARSSLFLDGEAYQQRRRVLAPHLGHRAAARHADEARRLTEEAFDRRLDGEDFGLQEAFDDITRRVIARSLFGTSRRFSDLVDLARDFLSALQSPLIGVPAARLHLGPWSPWGRFLNARANLRAALDAEARDRAFVPAHEAEDLMAALLAARFEGRSRVPSPESARAAAVDEILNLLAAGSETTSKALAWIFLGALSHPKSLSRLHRELDHVLGTAVLAAEDLERLPYLDAVIQEGLRFYPLAPFAGPRWTVRDVRLGRYRVPAGTVIVQCSHEMGRSPVFRNPNCFDPENFFARGIRQGDWYPFGGGHRLCAGMGVAKMILGVVTATALRHFDFELVWGSTRPKRVGLIVYQPENGVRVRLLGRHGLSPSRV